MKSYFALVLGCLGLFACGGTTTRAVRYDGHVTGAVNEPRTRIEVEERVAEECNLRPGSTYFTNDSSDLDLWDQTVLKSVAFCMNNGALRHESVVVVGYTDNNGSKAYNKGLGMTRAEAVADMLVANGVASKRLWVKSYGETKAGDKIAEADLARDRKVTLRVAEPD